MDEYKSAELTCEAGEKPGKPRANSCRFEEFNFPERPNGTSFMPPVLLRTTESCSVTLAACGSFPQIFLKWPASADSLRDDAPCLREDEALWNGLLCKTKWGERGDMSRGRNIRGAAAETQHFHRDPLCSCCGVSGVETKLFWLPAAVTSLGDLTPT